MWISSKLFFKKANSWKASGRGNLSWNKCDIKKVANINPVKGWILDAITPKKSLLLVFKKVGLTFVRFWIDFWRVKKIWIMKVKARPISNKGRNTFECKVEAYTSKPFGDIPA